MENTYDYRIEKVEIKLVPELLKFVMKVRKEVFPMLNHERLPNDLLDIYRYYLEPGDAAFFAAISSEGKVIGSLAVRRYDDRIKELKGTYDMRSTAEIVKCYVEASLRRRGVGVDLVRESLRFCRHAGYETIYLHTHRFLPGAVSFWQRQGFVLREEQKDSMETIHMDQRM